MSSTSPRTSTTRERKRPFLTSALPPAATLRARAAGDASPDWLLTTRAARARRCAVRDHDPPRDRPARRGADAPGGVADREWAVAVSRFLDELPAGTAAPARAAAARVRTIVARVAGAPGRHERDRGAARIPACLRAGRPGDRTARMAGGGRRDGVSHRARPEPDGDRARARLDPARPSDVRPSEAGSPGSRRCSGSRSGSRPRSARCSPSHPGSGCASLLSALFVAAVCFAPFVIVAPGALAHDLFGFYGIQNLQRLPFPLELRRTAAAEQADRVLHAGDPRAQLRRMGGGARRPRAARPRARAPHCGPASARLRARRSRDRGRSSSRRWRPSGSPTCSGAPTSST